MAYTVSWSKEDSRHKTQKSCPQGAVIQCFAYKLLTVTMGHIHCGGGIVLNCVWPLPSHGLYPSRLLCPQDFPGKNTGVGCHFLLQGIFPTQESNPGVLHCRQILYWLLYWATREALNTSYSWTFTALTIPLSTSISSTLNSYWFYAHFKFYLCCKSWPNSLILISSSI